MKLFRLVGRDGDDEAGDLLCELGGRWLEVLWIAISDI